MYGRMATDIVHKHSGGLRGYTSDVYMRILTVNVSVSKRVVLLTDIPMWVLLEADYKYTLSIPCMPTGPSVYNYLLYM